MKLAIPWSANVQNHYGDEYNISFNNMFNNFDHLFDFILSNKEIRFNIQPDDMTYQQMKALDTISQFIYFKIPFKRKIIKNMRKHGLKFFFEPKSAPSSFCLLEEQLMLGVTDIYLCDDLCYNLEKVKKACEKYNVQIRLTLNFIPSKRLDRGINPRAPIFIPESIDKLSKYVDIGEIETNSWVKIGTYYRIWFERKEWKENLRFIYPELEIDIPNESLIPNFLDFKMNCGYKCGYGSPCNKCEQFVKIAQDLRSKNIEIEKELV